MSCLQARVARISRVLAVGVLLCVGSPNAPAANLTNLTASSPGLLSQGTPSDVFNTIEADYGIDGRALRDNIDLANGVTGGWTMNATFTPSADDVTVGRTRLIMEIGGTSNGTGLWLVDGVPTLALKTAGSSPANLAGPTSVVASDLDITDSAAAIYSSFGRLTAGNEVTFAASWNTADTFTVAVQDIVANRGVVQTARVTGTSNAYNWYGNSTFLEGDLSPTGSTGNYGGLNESPYSATNPLSRDNATSFTGSFNGNDTLFWNAPATIALTAPATPVLTVAVDRASGAVTLTNPTNAAVTVNAYTLIGGRGGFDNGGGAQKQIGQSGGNLFTLAANGGSQNLGNVWVKSPFSDASAQIDVVGGSPVNALVTYSGPEYVLGDYNLSGDVDAGDWPQILAGLGTDVIALNGINEYLAGDLSGNGLVNRADFRQFKNLLASGAGSIHFGQNIPEPSAMLFSMIGLCGLLICLRRPVTRSCAALALLALAATSASASDIYFINTLGEIRTFTGFGVGENPIGTDKTFLQGTLVGNVSAYGVYQDFTHVPDGRVFGVTQAGGVDSWPSITNWLANTNKTAVSATAFGPEVITSPRSGIHGMSWNGNTGGFYVVYEGPDAQEGDLGVYSSLNNFVTNTTPAITVGNTYNGNLYNFWYPGEDAPAVPVTGANLNAQPGSNFFQSTGGGQLEGWSDLFTPGFGYFGVAGGGGGTGMGGNRSYQLAGFGADVIAAFADVSTFTPIDPSIRVDTRTGMVSLKPGSESVDIDYLQIESLGGGLTTTGFTGLGGAPGFPQGDGTANSTGWDQPPTNATSIVRKIEAFAFGSSTIATGGAEIPLGKFYDTTKDLRDLVLTFDRATDGAVRTMGGLYVQYFASAGTTGDYNNDGKVDAADYTVWRNNLNGPAGSLANRDPNNSGNIGTDDYNSWKRNFGAPSGSGSSVVASHVPEPSSLAILCGLAAILAAARSRRLRT